MAHDFRIVKILFLSAFCSLRLPLRGITVVSYRVWRRNVFLACVLLNPIYLLQNLVQTSHSEWHHDVFLWKLNAFLRALTELTSTSIVLTSGTRKLHRSSSRTPHTTHRTPHIASTYFFFSVYLISYPILIFLLAFPSQHFQLLILLLKIVQEQETTA